MALPISATPVLKGKEAKAFFQEMAENEKKQIPLNELLEIKNIGEEILRRNPTLLRSSNL
jgi:hypothetical protein